MKVSDFKPGDMIYADSNLSHSYDCFGVVVDKNFWFEQVNLENVLEESLSEFKEERHTPFRVLGTRLFEQHWRMNNPEELEPNNLKVMHYRFNSLTYTTKLDLRSFINLKNIQTDNFTEHVKYFFNFKDNYFQEVLHEAKIIYGYLGGERFDPKIHGSEIGYVGKGGKIEKVRTFDEDEKLLRLLNKAIPLNK